MTCDDTKRDIHDSWDRRLLGLWATGCFKASSEKCKACNMYIMYKEEIRRCAEQEQYDAHVKATGVR